MTLILASQSPIRTKILQDAGLNFKTEKATIDEDILKDQKPDLNPKDLALFLSLEKAKSLHHPSSFIIGADQTLEFEGKRLDKAKDIKEAKKRFQFLRGKSHYLHSSLTVVKEQTPLFTHTETVELTMRDFSDEFLDDYIKEVRDDCLTTVGGYKIEKSGVQLFSSIKGDVFSIMGLPLLPLLNFLRNEKIIAS